MTYYAHYLSVHRMDYNKFNSNIFASCSGDWRVKIWEDMRPYVKIKFFSFFVLCFALHAVEN